MKIAIVHDYLNQFGGAERVVQELHDIFPEAPIYTSIYDRNKMPAGINDARIVTSFMQNIPGILKHYRKYFFLYPLAFSLFDLSKYDVILSSSSAFAKGVRKRKGQLHICYCYTPMRFVWRYRDYVKRERFSRLTKMLLPIMLYPIKLWDLATARRVDFFVAISRTVADRIRRYYGRGSDIIYPPVNCDYFLPSGEDGDYFLEVVRLNPYKRIDLVVEAFNRLGHRLKIVGDGPDRERLQGLAKGNIEFLGKISDAELLSIIAGCRALIFPGEEDWGLAPLEAMSCGRPVIAFKGGAAVEFVKEPETGCFFDQPTVESLTRAVEKFAANKFDKRVIREHALRYDRVKFREQIKAYIAQKYKGYR
ncbi:hypothetical protein A3K48_00850 [candidate division WOR-1 bacterium RIFOXYA12_FULL_52_29]|uniref:Glycosyl transferase family 1 domain-containing protein n=1 Tax=candidate division WOR-1 bacterium RIFOXYC12_FULL_54_18 TaxID=1802584 RepID=A0A1F4T4T8_UNCSA|nr:MAG: hypothetical protein A3K44_00850 [candidate division WOR-1 bacterium RIFOXYA2_FULL_51_19]OGC17140.1 MAG: hypothetical protein A3K48_00850 [candidate division WOR-1 bacterium RIFOXYA12_FULL_52_29]OGC26000.1 MAG: hypothetical protein A3K32_00845 [candidate division WOR-1 bacterium RIFOXYB2_FULL_45_9]OGC27557.1 MAG: hypothetical protein A3K49_00850 [candidate division WOR-1 bacterium RIFOXYC12_FULL_54_18]OGC29230.1 MAG: hypothetical protein A2346_00860 [candidate division WOR-1 bacterium R